MRTAPFIGEPRRFDTYSHLGGRVGRPVTIDTIDAARRLFEFAGRTGRTVTLRGAGDALHDQACGGDVVAEVALPHRLSIEGDTLTASAGVTWAQALAAALASGQVPGVMPSTAKATLGGTLAANSLSQFSPLWGKESAGVEAFTLVTPAGDVRRVARPTLETPADERALFYGVIAGLGTLGLVTEVEHRLLPLHFDGPVFIETERRQPATHDAAVRELVDTHFEFRRRDRAGLWKGHLDASGASFWGAMTLSGRSCLCTKRYVPGPVKRRPFPFFQTRGPSSTLSHWLTALPHATRVFWEIAHYWLRATPALYWNPIYDGTFLMEANRQARDIAGRAGIELVVPQQTFVVPIDRPRDPYGPGIAFMATARHVLRRAGLEPSLIDVMTVPPEPALLSANRGMHGMAITIAFQRLGAPAGWVERLTRAMYGLTRRCADLGGRVHLTKNVLAEPAVVRRMYADALPSWRALKGRCDPNGVLSNGLVDRLFE